MLSNVRIYVEPAEDRDAFDIFVAGEAPDGKPAHLRVRDGRLVRHRHREGGRLEPLASLTRAMVVK